MSKGLVDPSALVTHVGGLDAVIETTLNLPNISGGKKLIYPHISLPLIAIDELSKKEGSLFEGLAEIVRKNNGIWSPKAEEFLLLHAPKF